MARITERDKQEFVTYLQNCTDAQVIGVLKKERKAGRRSYVRLAELEQARRDGRRDDERFANCRNDEDNRWPRTLATESYLPQFLKSLES